MQIETDPLFEETTYKSVSSVWRLFVLVIIQQLQFSHHKCVRMDIYVIKPAA